jgi:polyvinyl alcohol dehydrogenase (cytochrome)
MSIEVRSIGKKLAFILLVMVMATSLIAASSTTASWTSSGQSIVNWRSQPLETKITVKNASKLSPLFSVETDGDISATPNVSNGVVYFPTWGPLNSYGFSEGGSLYAVDATSGVVIWQKSLSDYTGLAGTVSRTTPTSATEGTLLVPTQKGAYLLAIDQNNGSLLWKVQLDTHPLAIITSSPSVYHGIAYMGVASLEEAAAADPSYPCCSFRGSIVAVNLSTHAIVWKTYTISDAASAAGYTGNGVWGSQPVVDPALNAVYVGTGNNYTAPTCDGNTCPNPADNLTDALLALDMNTGAIKWTDTLMGLGSDAWNVACFVPPYTNCPPNAGPDYDFGQAPMKIKAVINGKSVDILGIGQKSGDFWAINPKTGQVYWQTHAGPGSSLGGMEWGSATDGKRFYFSIANLYGIPYTLVDGSTTTAGSWGALDPATGKILWQTADPNGAFDTGAVSVANGVVYVGSMGYTYDLSGAPQNYSPAATNPTFLALDASNGHIVWNYVSGGSVNAGAAIANGVVYWGSGYGNQTLGRSNHKFYAFSVK